jgi:hypothetical protein
MAHALFICTLSSHKRRQGRNSGSRQQSYRRSFCRVFRYHKGMLQEMARRLATEPFEKRLRDGKVTDEWIIFATLENANYYLCLDTHRSGDEHIFHRIATNCFIDFPFLSECDWAQPGA